MYFNKGLSFHSISAEISAIEFKHYVTVISLNKI